MKRAALATILSQLLGLAVASAQPTPPDDDEAAPGDLDASPPPADGAPAEPAPPEEVVAEEVAAPEIDRGEPATEVGYDKGFFLKSGDGKYTLKFTGRVQPFYSGTRTGARSTNKNDFEIRRARVTVEGNVHTKNLLYKLQSDFGKGFLSLKDFHFDVKLADDVWLRVGQWKRPFSRQQINSSGKLELNDRAITDKAFGAERDIGVAIRNDYEKSPDIEWIVGVFNGSGVGARFHPTFDADGDVNGGSFSNLPTRFKPTFIGRVGLNDGGIKGYSEADLEGGGLRWGAAASVWIEGDYDSDRKSNQKVELDYVVKNAGFSTTGGFYGMSSQTEAAPFSSQELSHVGFHLQAGYMLTPKLQAAARFALVDVRPDFESGSAADQQEITVGGTFYAFHHDAKLVGAMRLLKTGDGSFTDDMLFELGANVGW